MAFPTTPTTGQHYAAANGTAYVFDGSGWQTEEVIALSAATTLGLNQYYFVDATDGTFTLTLPASPSDGDVIFLQANDAVSTNNVTISRNGNTINTAATDIVLSADNAEFALRYDVGTTDWNIEAYGATTATGGSTVIGGGSLSSYTLASTLASTANGNGSALVGVEDAAGDYTATTVEGVLAELPSVFTKTSVLASNANGEGASDIGIEDSAGIITATNVEGALAEIAGELNNFALTTNGNGASLIGIEDAAANFTATTVEGALTEILTDLASTANGLGAATIGIEDSGALITATTVEGALAELAAATVSNLNDLGDVDTATATSATGDFLRFDGSNYVPVTLITESGTAPTGTDLFAGAMWLDTTNDVLRVYVDNGGNATWLNIT